MDQYIKYFEATDDTDIYRPLVIFVTCKLFLVKAVRGCLPKKLPSNLHGNIFSATKFNSCRLLKNSNDRGKMCVVCKEATWFRVRKTADQIIRHENVGRPLEVSSKIHSYVSNMLELFLANTCNKLLLFQMFVWYSSLVLEYLWRSMFSGHWDQSTPSNLCYPSTRGLSTTDCGCLF